MTDFLVGLALGVLLGAGLGCRLALWILRRELQRFESLASDLRIKEHS